MILFETLEAKVRELAAANPTFIYVQQPAGSGCLYRPTEDDLGCIWGQALIALGADIDSFYEGKSIAVVLGSLGIVMTNDQRRWARYVQICQDQGMPWGEAVRRADSDLALLDQPV